jgi:hypothetical protein
VLGGACSEKTVALPTITLYSPHPVGEKKEKLGGPASVKGTMLEAHLLWAKGKLGGSADRLTALVPGECAGLIGRTILATDWIPFRCLVLIDRAIAQAVSPQDPDRVFADLGRHSASLNLGGVYKGFVPEEPHRFFEVMTVLHSRFQSFGHSSYERRGERSGRIRIEGYEEYSPVFCSSGLGYFEGALEMMKVPGPVRVVESACQCTGELACNYELSW